MALTYSASGDSEMVYKRLVQRVQQLSRQDRLMAAKEIAAILKVTEKTVHRWHHEERIELKGGGKRSKRFDLLEVMQAQRDAAKEAKQKRKKGKAE